MPDPYHPRSSPSSKPEKRKTVIDRTETSNAFFKKLNTVQNFFITNLLLQRKTSSIKDKGEIISPEKYSLNPIQSKSTQEMLSQEVLKFKKPRFLTKLSRFRIRFPSFIGFFGAKKMSDKQVGRPMKYPYTLTAKIAQFPFKFYINNNWMWKYYLIAVGVSFPLFYKLSRASNTPENKKVWDEIRKRDFAPGGHH